VNPYHRVSQHARVLTWLVCILAPFDVHAADAVTAHKWPEKTVRIVTPFAPGGGTDVFARLLAQHLTEVHGQPFVVENRPGAGSTLGTEHVAKAPADGYTFLMTSASFSFNPGLYPKLRFDPVKDFAPVSQVVRVPHVIVVLPSFPAANLQAFVRIARQRPGDVLYASSGAGSAMHLAGALFGIVTQSKLTHVPYKGGGATVVAVLSGEATTAFNTLETVIGTLRSGRLRALAVSTRERSAAIPDVPTAAEAGVADYEAIGWFGLFAPAGTPAATVRQLSTDVGKAMASPGMRDRAMNEGATPVGSAPAEFERFVHAEIAKWTKIVKQAGIQLE
jgi:tripartite-type tricarboxylate transporter receptor subunit TctC